MAIWGVIKYPPGSTRVYGPMGTKCANILIPKTCGFHPIMNAMSIPTEHAITGHGHLPTGIKIGTKTGTQIGYGYLLFGTGAGTHTGTDIGIETGTVGGIIIGAETGIPTGERIMIKIGMVADTYLHGGMGAKTHT